MGAILTCRTEPGRRSGGKRPAGAICSRVRSAALPIPRSRHYCLSVALWDGFRCSAYGATRPAENLGPGGVKSVEAVPRPWLTFNLVQKHRGGHKIEPRSAEYPIRGCTYSPPRKPSEIPPSGGFRFVGQQIQFRDYVAIYSIAISVIQPYEKAPAMELSERLKRASPRRGAQPNEWAG